MYDWYRGIIFAYPHPIDLIISYDKKNINTDENNNYNDNDNEFKTKVLIENHIKEDNDNTEEVSNQKEEISENQRFQMEADINMKINSEKLIIFNEINQNYNEKKDSNEFKKDSEEEMKEVKNEIINVFQEQDQKPNSSDSNKQQIKIEYLEKADNHEVQYLNSEENYFSQDIRKGSDTTTNNQPHFALIDHLLEFVDTFKPLNYVLCGYFAKIFNNLLNLKTNNLMRYIIFSKREFLKSLVHS